MFTHMLKMTWVNTWEIYLPRVELVSVAIEI